MKTYRLKQLLPLEVHGCGRLVWSGAHLCAVSLRFTYAKLVCEVATRVLTARKMVEKSTPIEGADGAGPCVDGSVSNVILPRWSRSLDRESGWNRV